MYKNICTFNFFLIKLVLVILEGDESMPNMKNAIKKVKQIKKTTEFNRHYTSTVKNAIKNTEKAIAKGDKATAEVNLKNTIKYLDNAKVKGLIHQNKVNREKSRLTKKVNAMEVK